MPSRFVLKGMNVVHRSLLAVTFGKFGWHVGGMHSVKLHTVGRKSGQKRMVMLTSPIQFGDDWVLVASKGGDPDNPAWFLNLRDNPAVEVETRQHGLKPTTARIATTDEKAEWWPRITAAYKGYEGYQNRTTRDIPLVVVNVAGR